MTDHTSCFNFFDGNAWIPNAVCSPTGCVSDTKLVFLSGSTFNGNGGGVAAADALCATTAANAGIPGTFKAWLSDGSGSAASRMTHATVPYMRGDGVKVADDWTDLTDNTLDAPISTGIYGNAVGSVEVFTSTFPNGDAVEFDCDDWTNAGGVGTYGLSSATNTTWTAADLTSCATPRQLYCIQQ